MSPRPRCVVLGAALAAAATAATTATARADGFRILQGGPSIGNAGAGSAAAAEDPSTAFFNPAGMTSVRRGAAVQVNAIDVGLRFDDDGSRGARSGRPLSGGNGREAGVGALAPGAFAVAPLGERWACGIAVTSPFGLETDYGTEWVGRYFATRSLLQTLDVAPSLAWRASDRLSIGAGVDFQALRADLGNAIDFGAVAVNSLGEDRARALHLTPQRDDGSARLTGESFAVGANAGLLWRASERTRIGLTWRSAVRHDIEGDAEFTVPRDARRLRLGGYFVDTDASSEITLPEVASIGVVHAIDRAWTAVAGADWTRWSRFQTLDIRFANPRQEALVEDENWRDTLRPAAGLVYRPDAKWTFRVGASYDPSTVADSDRHARSPDVERITLAAGVGVRLSESATLEVQYLHAWGHEATIDVRSRDQGHLVGSYRTSVDYASVQLTLDW